MSLKIQINNLEALERLLGGDTEIEFDIRQNIVETFARKHIKTLVNDELISKATEGLKKEIEDAFVIKTSGWSGSYALTTKAREMLKEHIDLEKKILVQGLVNEHFTNSGLDALIREKAEWVSGQLAAKVLSDKFDAAVENEIKRRLGIK